MNADGFQTLDLRYSEQAYSPTGWRYCDGNETQ